MIKLKRYLSFFKCMLFVFALMMFSIVSIMGLESSSQPQTTPMATDQWIVGTEVRSTTIISDVQAGGVGTITYRQTPACLINVDDIYDANKVVIPIENYKAGQDVMSIKYETNIPIADQANISLYGEYESNGETVLKLFAFFTGWNTKDSGSIDGKKIKTISGMSGYLDRNVVTKLHIVFECRAEDYFYQEDRIFKALGISFHKADETPTFVTDPKNATLGELTNEAESTRYTINKTANGLRVQYTDKGSGKLVAPVQNWSNIFGQLVLTLRARENTKIVVYADDVKLEDYNLKDSIITTNEEVTLYYSIPDTICKVTNIKIAFDPDESGYSANTGLTEIIIKSFEITGSYSMGDYVYGSGLKFGEDSSGATTIAFRGQDWLSATRSLNFYNRTYDTLVLTVKGKKNSSLGIRVVDTSGSDYYLRNHWDSESLFKDDEETTLMFFGIDKVSNLPLKAIELWFDPPTNLVASPNTGEQVFTIKRFELIQSFLMPTLDISVSDLTVDYDGNPHEVLGSTTSGLPLISYYKNADDPNSEFSSDVPKNGGTYIVESRFLGNEDYKYSVGKATLKIQKVSAPVPSLDLVAIDYVEGELVFEDGVEVGLDNEFINTIVSGTSFVEGQTYFIRTIENTNYYTSTYITMSVNSREDVTLNADNLEVTYTGATHTITATANQEGEIRYEYKLSTEDDSCYSESAPLNVQSYTVRITYLGNENYKTAVKTVTLEIKKRTAFTPTAKSISINYFIETISFDDQIFEVAFDEDFTNLIHPHDALLLGEKIYIKQLANMNENESNIFEYTIPNRTAGRPSIDIDYLSEQTTSSILTSLEYKKSDGVWTRGIGSPIPLEPNSIYYFRVRATANSFASEIQTLFVPKRQNKPHAVSLLSATSNSVTIVPVEGYEYKCGDGLWQDSNIFEGLEKNTEYTFYARQKATTTQFASLEVSNLISTNQLEGGCNGNVAYSMVSITISIGFIAVWIRRRKKIQEEFIS